MKMTLVCVGKLKEKFWAQACAEYIKRLEPYARLEIREVADLDPGKAGGEKAALEKEGAVILSRIPNGSHCILLAIEGKTWSSEGLSAHLDEHMVHGASDFTFVIGGSCGVSDAVYARADETLSFGPLTLPHNLARVVLLEQLYRACKISRGEPYHK